MWHKWLGLMKTNSSSEPLGGDKEHQLFLFCAWRVSLVGRADPSHRQKSDTPFIAAWPWAHREKQEGALSVFTPNANDNILKNADRIWEGNRGKKKFGAKPRRHGDPKKDQQESAGDEPRVYHPEPCRYCFLCCYGVPPRADVRGKSRPHLGGVSNRQVVRECWPRRSGAAAGKPGCRTVPVYSIRTWHGCLLVSSHYFLSWAKVFFLCAQCPVRSFFNSLAPPHSGSIFQSLRHISFAFPRARGKHYWLSIWLLRIFKSILQIACPQAQRRKH